MNATKQATHTPGPWHVGDGKAEIIVYAPDGYAVADAKVYHARHAEGETVANARLIAAAPDLLAALQSLLPWMHLLGDHIGNGVLADPHGHGVPIGDDERCRAILAARAARDRATGYA